MYTSIGSGEPFSEIFFDQTCYSSACSLEKGLFLAYHAKKSAELHPGVGVKTDIMILRKGKPKMVFQDGSSEIDILDNCRKAEIQEMTKIRVQFEEKIRDEVIKHEPNP
jgi:hypothetical protein